MEDLSTALGAPAPPEVLAGAPLVADATIKVASPGSSLWDRFKESVGSAQSAIASPLQSAGRSAAKAVGASDQTASTVGASIPVVLVVLVAVVCYVAYKGGKFFGKRSIKL